MKKFTLYLTDEKQAYWKSIAKENNTNLNALINSILDKAMNNEEIFSMELKFNTTVQLLTEALNNQTEAFNSQISWHKIHAEMIKELLMLEE